MLRLLTRIIGSALVLGIVCSAGNAYAQKTVPQGKPSIPDVSPVEGHKFFGSVTIMSDNRSQGFTSSLENPAIEGNLGLIYRNFYIGIGADSVDFGKAFDTKTKTLKTVADVEVSYYAGYVNTHSGIDYDINFAYMTYPNAFDPTGNFDYLEVSVGAAVVLVSDLKTGLRIYYSPEYSGDTGQNWIFEGSLEKPLGTLYHGWRPSAVAIVGYQEGEQDKGNIDYWYWELGIEVAINEHFSVDFMYQDTADVPFDCSGICDEAFVASATLQF